MRPIVTSTLVAGLLVAGCSGDGSDGPAPLSAGQEAAPGPVDARGPGEPTGADRDRQGGGHGVPAPVEVAEHQLGEDRGFVITASLEEDQVCVTATALDAGDEPAEEAAVTDCSAPDTPLDLRVLVLDDLEVLAGIVTDPRASDVTLIDVGGTPVPDEADAAPMVELTGTDHRAFAAATPASALATVELADADGTVIADRRVPETSTAGHEAP